MNQTNANMVDVIIVNYRTASLTLQAVRSVLDEPELGRVLVVDNGSGDDSVAELKKGLDNPRVVIIPLEKNVGFGAGNNVAATHSTAQYLFFLNSDAWIKPGCLGELKKILDLNSGIGVVAPAIFLPDQQTLQADAVGVFPTPLLVLTGKTRQQPSFERFDWVSGVACMVRRQEFVSYGGFNKRLFMYLEDVELCFRYHNEGKRIVRQPQAKVIHLGGGSKKSTKLQKDAYYRSLDTYFQLTGISLPVRLFVRILIYPYRLIRGW